MSNQVLIAQMLTEGMCISISLSHLEILAGWRPMSKLFIGGTGGVYKRGFAQENKTRYLHSVV